MTRGSQFRHDVGLFFKGFCMGVANIIPGVSGGTMAFILGIYEEFMDSIKSFDMTFLKLLFTFKIREAFGHASWRFLGVLLAGILFATATFAKIISWLMTNAPVYINAFFFGLILASGFIIVKSLKKKDATVFALILLSALASYFLVGMVPVTTPETYAFLFLSGAIAICAMVLPGISGSFILVLLGKYQYVLDAVNDRNLVVLSVFAGGICVGIITFARIVSWLLHRYYDITMAVLTGLMMGALRKIWPWKQTLKTMVDRHGEAIPILEKNILPAGFNLEVLYVLLLVIGGLAIALSLENWAVSDPKD